MPTPVPGPGEVLIRAHAIGVCMPEVLVRRGEYYWMPPLPTIPGIEMSGIVEAIGEGVTSIECGSPVFVSARELPHRSGCYAEYRTAPAEAVYRLPAAVDLDAAACLSNYQVAWHLLHSATRGMPFETVLVPAAAGGVGSAIVQLARVAGKQVLGVVSSPEKAAFAERMGAKASINHRTEDVTSRVKALTNGAGVDLILDPVGGPGTLAQFDRLAPFGMLIHYGMLAGWASGDLLGALKPRFADCLAFRTFSMHAFDADRTQRRNATEALIALLADRCLQPPIHTRLPLADAARAHTMLESGTVLGKLLLKP
ncbi:MAG: zinc-dependent alcohol dehydrogenase family protein [Burkholderiales bacterium]